MDRKGQEGVEEGQITCLYGADTGGQRCRDVEHITRNMWTTYVQRLKMKSQPTNVFGSFRVPQTKLSFLLLLPPFLVPCSERQPAPTLKDSLSLPCCPFLPNLVPSCTRRWGRSRQPQGRSRTKQVQGGRQCPPSVTSSEQRTKSANTRKMRARCRDRGGGVAILRRRMDDVEGRVRVSQGCGILAPNA